MRPRIALRPLTLRSRRETITAGSCDEESGARPQIAPERLSFRFRYDYRRLRGKRPLALVDTIPALAGQRPSASGAVYNGNVQITRLDVYRTRQVTLT